MISTFKYSEIYFDLYQWANGCHQQKVIENNSLFFILKGMLQLKISDKHLLINADGKRGHMVALKRKSEVIFSVIADTTIVIFSFKAPLMIMGYEPIKYLSMVKEINDEQNRICTLPISPLLADLLTFVKSSIREDKRCSYFTEFASAWLFFLLKQLYSQEQLCTFFTPLFENAGTDFRSFILYNYRTCYKIKDLIEKGHYSTSDFKRKFQKEFGEPPGKWINERRKEDIDKLLKESDDSLEVIAEKCRFASLESFHKYCKREFNCAPKDLRKADKRHVGEL